MTGRGGRGQRERGSPREGWADGGALQLWKHWSGDPYWRKAWRDTENLQSKKNTDLLFYLSLHYLVRYDKNKSQISSFV